MKQIIKKCEDAYNNLNPEQESFLLYGVFIPCAPMLLLWFFCFFFFSYSFLQAMGDILLCAYSIVCSALSVYIGLKEKRRVRKLLYFFEISFIACTNVALNRHDNLKDPKMIYIVYIVIFVIFGVTILNVRELLGFISDDKKAQVNEVEGE